MSCTRRGLFESAKGDLPAKVDYFPSSLGSSRMTIFFKTKVSQVKIHKRDLT